MIQYDCMSLEFREMEQGVAERKQGASTTQEEPRNVFDKFRWEFVQDACENLVEIQLSKDEIKRCPELNTLANSWSGVGKRVATFFEYRANLRKGELPKIKEVTSRMNRDKFMEKEGLEVGELLKGFPPLPEVSVWIELVPLVQTLILGKLLKPEKPQGDASQKLVFVSASRLKDLATRHATKKKESLKEETF